MMSTRTIPVSTDLYAAIWRAQKPGEETEEDILRRILNIPDSSPPDPAPASNGTTAPATTIGFRDPRFGIELPEDFQIFRVYKGIEYKAKAVAGQWLLMSTGDMYPSLNQLSFAVTKRPENAWNAWYYHDKRGKRRLMDTLRKK
jgi:negative regulator of replication initiation